MPSPSASVTPLFRTHPQRARGNTFAALLADTADLLDRLDYQNRNSADAASIQAEAIRTLLKEHGIC